VLQDVVRPGARVFEVASGPGQHAAYLSEHLAGVTWQPTELPEWHASIEAWREGAQDRILAPLELDLYGEDPFSGVEPRWDVVFSVNVIHIVAWPGVCKLIEGAGRALVDEGLLVFYGPFRYRDRPLEPSNARFEQWLHETFEGGGLRVVEESYEQGATWGLVPHEDREVPSNNRVLMLRRER